MGGFAMLSASCHCDAVHIELEALPTYLDECGCSICRCYGALWVYCRPDQVHFLCEASATQGYLCDDGTLEYYRCRVCGCVTHWMSANESASQMGVSARLLDPSDIAGIPIRRSNVPP